MNYALYLLKCAAEPYRSPYAGEGAGSHMVRKIEQNVEGGFPAMFNLQGHHDDVAREHLSGMSGKEMRGLSPEQGGEIGQHIAETETPLWRGLGVPTATNAAFGAGAGALLSNPGWKKRLLGALIGAGGGAALGAGAGALGTWGERSNTRGGVKRVLNRAKSETAIGR